MIKKDRPRIYSKYEINSMLFYGTVILFTPLILVFTYVFNIEKVIDPIIFLLIVLGVNLLIGILGTLFLFLKKDSLKRMVKSNYIYEFYFLVIISVFGILGMVVLFDYLGGNRQYIANILILVVVIFVYILLQLGRKFFKFDFKKRK
jgi:hypothetical protein